MYIKSCKGIKKCLNNRKYKRSINVNRYRENKKYKILYTMIK